MLSFQLKLRETKCLPSESLDLQTSQNGIPGTLFPSICVAAPQRQGQKRSGRRAMLESIQCSTSGPLKVSPGFRL